MVLSCLRFAGTQYQKRHALKKRTGLNFGFISLRTSPAILTAVCLNLCATIWDQVAMEHLFRAQWSRTPTVSAETMSFGTGDVRASYSTLHNITVVTRASLTLRLFFPWGQKLREHGFTKSEDRLHSTATLLHEVTGKWHGKALLAVPGSRTKQISELPIIYFEGKQLCCTSVSWLRL